MFVSERSRVAIVYVMGLAYAVQSIDAWITSLESFLQVSARTHILVAGPMKLLASFRQQFLYIQFSTPLSFFWLSFSLNLPFTSLCHLIAFL